MSAAVASRGTFRATCSEQHIKCFENCIRAHNAVDLSVAVSVRLYCRYEVMVVYSIIPRNGYKVFEINSASTPRCRATNKYPICEFVNFANAAVMRMKARTHCRSHLRRTERDDGDHGRFSSESIARLDSHRGNVLEHEYSLHWRRSLCALRVKRFPTHEAQQVRCVRRKNRPRQCARCNQPEGLDDGICFG